MSEHENFITWVYNGQFTPNADLPQLISYLQNMLVNSIGVFIVDDVAP